MIYESELGKCVCKYIWDGRRKTTYKITIMAKK